MPFTLSSVNDHVFIVIYWKFRLCLMLRYFTKTTRLYGVGRGSLDGKSGELQNISIRNRYIFAMLSRTGLTKNGMASELEAGSEKTL